MKRNFFIIIPIFAFLSIFPAQCQETVGDAGLYRSNNMGESWTQLFVKGEQVSITSLNILDVAVDPTNSDVIYVGTRENGIYKSCSKGQYWYKMEDENNVFSSRANVYDLAIDPKDPKRIYAGTYQDRKGMVFRSQDGGISWEEVYVVSEEAYAVFAVAIDNYDSSIVYIGTAQGGFLKSVDYGKSWETLKWFDDVISDIAVNPQDTKIIYVSTFENGIYKTTDKGANWISFMPQLEKFKQADKAENLVIDPKRPNILYSGSEYGLLTTKDGGASWQEVNIIMPPESAPILSLAIENDNTDHLYYSADSVLYRSLDQGKNWTVHELFSSKNIKTIAIDPNDPDIIYVGMHKNENN